MEHDDALIHGHLLFIICLRDRRLLHLQCHIKTHLVLQILVGKERVHLVFRSMVRSSLLLPSVQTNRTFNSR